jgi:transcriptional regulator with XRE-family HTH domain
LQQQIRAVPRIVFDMRVGLRLSEGLAAIGLTQAKLARRLNTSPQSVYNWTKGKTSLQTHDLYRIFRHTGLSSDFLLAGLPGGHLASQIQEKLPPYLFDEDAFNARVAELLTTAPPRRRKRNSRPKPKRPPAPAK